MRFRSATFALLTVMTLGCYTGAEFTLGAPSLEKPVSMSQFVHDPELNVLGPGDYDEVNGFVMSFSGWSFGWPLSPHPEKDFTERLNDVVRQNDGDGIVNLRISAGNNPLNSVTMFIKGVSWFVLVGGSLVLLSYSPDKAEIAPLVAGSIVTILFLPTGAEFTVKGTVVRFRKKDK
ncbi:MAG: hypothetical protein HYY49_09660 [Ignavibacteriales bacterium]|nr:hypothetical protein [Ignavibacteriales bacterium]